jgi:N-acetylmuramoyl-L-alanine amidase
MYISLHINYLDNPKYYGGQVFYIDGNQRLANIIQDEFIRQLSSPLKVRNMDDNIYMYKKLDIPGVLIECGFMSNVKERNLLVNSKYQSKIVKCIIDGLINYY